MATSKRRSGGGGEFLTPAPKKVRTSFLTPATAGKKFHAVEDTPMSMMSLDETPFRGSRAGLGCSFASPSPRIDPFEKRIREGIESTAVQNMLWGMVRIFHQSGVIAACEKSDLPPNHPLHADWENFMQTALGVTSKLTHTSAATYDAIGMLVRGVLVGIWEKEYFRRRCETTEREASALANRAQSHIISETEVVRETAQRDLEAIRRAHTTDRLNWEARRRTLETKVSSLRAKVTALETQASTSAVSPNMMRCSKRRRVGAATDGGGLDKPDAAESADGYGTCATVVAPTPGRRTRKARRESGIINDAKENHDATHASEWTVERLQHIANSLGYEISLRSTRNNESEDTAGRETRTGAPGNGEAPVDSKLGAEDDVESGAGITSNNRNEGENAPACGESDDEGTTAAHGDSQARHDDAEKMQLNLLLQEKENDLKDLNESLSKMTAQYEGLREYFNEIQREGARLVVSSSHDARAVLGVEHCASPADIRACFRKLAILFHPDKMAGNPLMQEATDKSAAFRVIMESQRSLLRS